MHRQILLGFLYTSFFFFFFAFRVDKIAACFSYVQIQLHMFSSVNFLFDVSCYKHYISGSFWNPFCCEFGDM